jgi:hypothetical protein
MEGEMKDFTLPICGDCVNRVLRVVHITLYDLESGEMREGRQVCCGIELDRHPNQCRYKVPRISRL